MKSSPSWLDLYQLRRLEVNQLSGGAGNRLEFYPPGVVRYAYRDICRRVKERVDLSGKPLKDIQGDVGISKDQWSRKMKVNPQGTGGTRTSWTYEELTKLAAHFSADPGWPFIEWSEATAVRRALEALERLSSGGTINRGGPAQVPVVHEPGPLEAKTHPPGRATPTTPRAAAPSTARPGSRRTGAGRH